MSPTAEQSDPRWTFLESARADLLRALAADSVTRIEYVAAFPQDKFAVWLGTDGDEQRDRLGVDSIGDKVRDILLRHGFSEAWLSDLVTTAQSQETVDRDYQGSWFYALR